MNWPRVKWILIVMLALGNLLLAGLFLQRRYEARRDMEQFEGTLLSVLSARGVTLAPEVTAQLFDGAHRLYVLRDKEREDDLALLLLGQTERRDQGGRFWEYENEAGRALFWDSGRFRVDWDHPIKVQNTIEQDAAELFEKVGFPSEPAPVVEQTSTGLAVTLFQFSDGYPVFDAFVSLQYENQAAVSMSGQWLWGTPLAAEDEPPCPVLGATLLRFTDRQPDDITGNGPISHVEAVQAGYFLSAVSSEYLCLIPVWQITADGQIFYVDAETGSLVVLAYEPF